MKNEKLLAEQLKDIIDRIADDVARGELHQLVTIAKKIEVLELQGTDRYHENVHKQLAEMTSKCALLEKQHLESIQQAETSITEQ